jgi:hypothetical protein
MEQYSTNEYKVKLYLENNEDKPVLEYFDPTVFLSRTPVFLTDNFLSLVSELYMNKIRKLNLLDTLFLKKLSDEAALENIPLKQCMEGSWVSKRLEKVVSLYEDIDLPVVTGVEYFEKYPNGRCLE